MKAYAGIDFENEALIISLRREKEEGSNMNEEQKQRKESIAALLHQTAEDHHVAFQETGEVDPDWSIWYAGHLLDARLLKSDVIYLLVLVDKQQMSEAPGAHWERYYADFFVNRYLK
jgi:hypothetical protein